MSQAVVSTIIPVYNRPQFIGRCVQSVLDQSWSAVEIIIVDDGSTDETSTVIDKLVALAPDKIKSIRIENAGPGPAREAGRLLATGEYIQYLDSDDLLLPNKFMDQVRALEHDPEAGIAYGITRLVDETGKVIKERYKWTDGTRTHLFPDILVDRWWCTHTPLYRKEVTDLAGPWSNLRYSQDWEYDARIGARGIKLIQCDSVVSEHTMHTGSRQTGSGRWLEASEEIEFFKRMAAYADEAKVEKHSPQRTHFGRWVFSRARRAINIGDMETAKELIAISSEVTSEQRIIRAAYRHLPQLIGWRGMAFLDKGLRAVSGGKASSSSMKLSWVD